MTRPPFKKRPARDVDEAEANRLIPVRLGDDIIVEAVFYGGDTLCLSTQAGCAVGCPFCASGSAGFFRSLSAQEMQAQVDAAVNEGLAPVRLTLSGIGEPLMNAGAVQAFMDASPLPVSLTTTGTPLRHLEHFLVNVPHNGLTVSLHAGTPDIHKRLVPHGADFASLIALLRRVVPALPSKRRRKTSLNYLVVEGVNDADADIDAFMEMVDSLGGPMVNLLMVNDVERSELKSPSKDRIDEIHERFRSHGLDCRRPNPWRRLADGGCGTLFAKTLTPCRRTP